MATDDGALLRRSVCSNPADDTARLVYADWLQENGEEARARYIRWMLKGRFTHPFPYVSWRKWFAPWWSGETCRRHVMDDVPTLLLMKVRGHSGGFDDWHQARVTRGFLSRVELPASAFVLFAESIFRREPVTDVRPRDVKAWNSDNRRWGWSKQDADLWTGGPNWVLPEELFDLLPTAKCVRPFAKSRHWWGNEHDAYAALNIACVAYGRDLAKLPPLPGEAAA